MNAADRTSQTSRPPKPKPAAQEPRTSEALRRASGRDRPEWFALLDAWGAAGRPYREIVDWLTVEHSLSDWWAQKLIVEYEEARGLRAPGVRRDGTFEVGASKTVAVPAARLYAAFTDARLRERWLPGAVMKERQSRSQQSVSFDWGDGSSRVEVGLLPKGKARSEVSVQHKRLPDSKSAEKMKAHWRERLVALKALLEG
jgi:uncharacterized protein YndB with AHSA1/START domain